MVDIHEAQGLAVINEKLNTEKPYDGVLHEDVVDGDQSRPTSPCLFHICTLLPLQHSHTLKLSSSVHETKIQ